MSPQIVFLLNKSLESLRNSNLESAELYLNQALKLHPSNPHVLRLLGVVSAQRKDYSDALKYLNESLKALPKNSATLSNLGNIFIELKQYENALDYYDKSLKIDSKNHEAWSNKGNALYALKRYEEAVSHHDKALSLKPDYVEGWSNKGNALKELKRFDEAIAHYDQALILKSHDPDASWNKSMTLLLLGDYENGLPLYESRWHSKIVSDIGGRRLFNKPTWFGVESLQGKTILLYGEQGLGDVIQFCRYIKLVADLGAKVILEVPETLAALMQSIEGISQLVIKGEEPPFFDYQCPLLSLPLALKATLFSIPDDASYLTADSNKVAKWKLKLGERSKKRIGLVWSSMSDFKNDSSRSLMLEDFVRALPSEGFEYICLQKELKESDKEFFANYKNIKFLGDELKDFSDTAALIENLDLVISTCTSVPHLSGALGKETWILISHVPDWRWLLDREDSPWYPTIKLYRQDAVGDWNSVLDRVKLDLTGIL